MAKDSDWSLSEFSQSLKRQSDRINEERETLNRERGEPDIFKPDTSEGASEGHGMGIWILPEHVVVIRKMSNGYERYPSAQYDRSFIEEMASAIQKKFPK